LQVFASQVRQQFCELQLLIPALPEFLVVEAFLGPGLLLAIFLLNFL
jgi:ABC-type dipeptide/oligopeptide/nickel transport system permease subunit